MRGIHCFRAACRRGGFIAGVFGIFVVCGGCSENAPRIPYGVLDLVYYQEAAGPVEQLQFFVMGEDDDGPENLDILDIYHDRAGLRWHLSASDWVRLVSEGKTWIGSRAITAPDSERLPRGQYRAVLINKGGDHVERTFTFDPSVTYPFPQFTITGGQYLITSKYPEHILLTYNESGSFVSAIPLTAPRGAVADLALPAQVRTAALWARDSGAHVAAFTRPVPVRSPTD